MYTDETLCELNEELHEFLEENIYFSICIQEFSFHRDRNSDFEGINGCVCHCQHRSSITSGPQVLLDLSSAFDSVDFNILIERLYHSFVGRVLDWFESYLTKLTMCVHYNGTYQTLIIIFLCGVLQGSVLGPVIFILYYVVMSSRLPQSIVSKPTHGRWLTDLRSLGS